MDLAFYPERTDRLDLNILDRGMPGITERLGGALAEAAVECLDRQKHAVGVTMLVDGAFVHSLQIVWKMQGDEDQRRRTWRDPNPSVEHGAYGLAALMIEELTDYTVVERAWKGDGFDFWLGPKGSTGFLFQDDRARLEVSGIRQDDAGAVKRRVSDKEKQILPSKGSGLPGVVIVVEFGAPRTRVTCT
jgi:hypothetical protein